jgi:SET domain-containing protein
MHPATHVARAPGQIGDGLFASEAIAPGREILRFSGPILTLPQVRAKGHLAANALQIGLASYLDLEPPGRLVNHSCDPNAAVFDNVRLVSLRPISAGDEIRFDYSTTISDGWTMACCCGSPRCRRLVAAFQLLPRPLRLKYELLGCVQRFIVEAVGA